MGFSVGKVRNAPFVRLVSAMVVLISFLVLITACGGTGFEDSNTSQIERLGTAQTRIAASADDAEETAEGNVKTRSSDIDLTYARGGSQTVGLRFADVKIPEGATVQEAYIQFTVDETQSVATNLTVHGEAADDALRFTSDDKNISSRARTAERVVWSPTPWYKVAEAGSAQRTPSLSGVVQEIIERPGWKQGNALVFVISGQGERTAEAYDGSRNAAPTLFLKFDLTGQEPEPEPQPDLSCLETATGKLLTLSGTYEAEYEASVPDYARIDATDARFLAPAPEDPFTVFDGKNLCISGGLYDAGISDDETDWEVFHHSQGIYLRDTPNVIVENVSIAHTGDGIRFTEGSRNWTVRSTYIQHAGDDAIENDFLYSGLVDDVLIDAAYVGFSCRLGSSDRFTGYSPGGTMTVQNSLVALRLQKGVYKGTTPGGGQLWKWEHTDTPGCKLAMRNNIVLVEEGSRSNYYLSPADDPNIDYATVVESKNNIVVWTGEGSYPAPIPDGWTLTRDIGVWERARADWFARHPQIATVR